MEATETLTQSTPFTDPMPYADLRRMAGVSRAKADRIRGTKAYAPWFEDGFTPTPQGVMVSPLAASVFVEVAARMDQGQGAAEIVPALEGMHPPHGAPMEACTVHEEGMHGATHGADPGTLHGAEGEACTVQGGEGEGTPHGAMHGAPMDDRTVQELAHLRELVAMQSAHLADLRREVERAGDREAVAARSLAGEREAWREREGRLHDALTREQEGMMALTKALASGNLRELVETARERGIPTHGLEGALEATVRPASGAGEGTPEARRPWWKVWGGRAAAF
ncbi:MAG: hypothetical protein AMXMBFR75_32400 [Candidatus Hinthialibacteria bacterium]